jgi:hypothetical protein
MTIHPIIVKRQVPLISQCPSMRHSGSFIVPEITNKIKIGKHSVAYDMIAIICSKHIQHFAKLIVVPIYDKSKLIRSFMTRAAI